MAQSSPVALSVDGVYYSTVSGTLVDVFDVSQIEVLRGPQGTLQGRNAPGGAVNVTTRRPSGEYGMRWQLSYARFDQLQARVAVEAPIVANVLAVKLSGFYNNGGAFMNNLTIGRKNGGALNNWGGRLSVLFTPSPDLTAYLTVDYMKDRSEQPPNRPRPHAGSLGSNANGSFEPSPAVCTVFGYCSEYGKYETGSNFVTPASLKNFGTSLNVDWDIGGVALSSVTGYRDVKDNLRIDADALPVTALHFVNKPQRVEQFSQELRLASDGNGPLTYVVGAYYLNYSYKFFQQLELGGPLAGLPAGTSFLSSRESQERTHSFALFGQASYKITDSWSVSGGVRQTWDRKRLVATPRSPGPSQAFKTDFKNLSIEAGTEYRLDQDKLAYVRFSQGYRSGGFNEGGAFPTINVYKPEKVDSYELGLKTEWLDRRLKLNASAFQYAYKDMQIVTLTGSVAGNINRIINAKTTRIRGVELELVAAPTDNFNIRGTVGYLDARYPNQIVDLGTGPVNLRNVQKDNTPKWTASVGTDYTIDLGSDGSELQFAADLSYKSRFATNPNPTPIAIQDKYALLNASITYKMPDDRFAISIFGQNLTDKYYKVIGESGNNFFLWDTVGRPRTYGVKLSASF
ncbi:outer membrane receptor protein [Sphingobium fuliginis]|uniref:Outer membrane receptor protein n=1 Tax=Sphingobium fuliginis (strain ATCC 27551) TaxID=336203 RepID=A0A292ZGZ1_SPHSA|nr:outer membrane receptor protein [Sphingobium fuliginis]